MKLRPYQQEAVNAAQCQSGLIEAATGAGKSHIIAELARLQTGKTLVIQPSKELVEQNYQKYLLTGEPASIWCAALNKKCLRHKVVFGSPLSIKNSLDKFNGFSMVIVDEAHNITPSLIAIINKLGNVQVVGLTATPYRMLSGHICKYGINGELLNQDAYFDRLLYQITTDELLNQGYLTPVTTTTVNGYQTKHLTTDRKGQFNSVELEQATTGQGRKTATIVSDIVAKAHNRKGVLIFATSRKHAIEILESLPPGNSALVTGDTAPKERAHIINEFKAQKIKYLVNVNVLTTGFDAPHVDFIALLRPTESPGLLQQIIGRGLRLWPGKEDCLLIDYAENLERHGLSVDNLFTPKLDKARPSSRNEIAVICPRCDTKNMFAKRKAPNGVETDKNGYLVDLMGSPVTDENGNPYPGHYGRKCFGMDCNYYWTFKQCAVCGHKNDIAARQCKACKAEIINPNDKLVFKPHGHPVSHWLCNKHESMNGNDCIKIQWFLKDKQIVTFYTPQFKPKWIPLCRAVYGKVAPDVDTFLKYIHSHGRKPSTINYEKNGKYYEITGYGI